MRLCSLGGCIANSNVASGGGRGGRGGSRRPRRAQLRMGPNSGRRLFKCIRVGGGQIHYLGLLGSSAFGGVTGGRGVSLGGLLCCGSLPHSIRLCHNSCICLSPGHGSATGGVPMCAMETNSDVRSVTRRCNVGLGTLCGLGGLRCNARTGIKRGLGLRHWCRDQRGECVQGVVVTVITLFYAAGNCTRVALSPSTRCSLLAYRPDDRLCAIFKRATLHLRSRTGGVSLVFR